MAIIRNPRYVFNEDGSINLETVRYCLNEHRGQISRFDTLKDYYDGNHSISGRELSDTDAPNNKVTVNHAEYITDFATGYFMGNEISYVGEKIEPITENFKAQHIHMVDTELSRDLSIYGIAYERPYMSSDDVPIPKSTNIDPRNAFVIVDDTVEYKTLLGINYYPRIDGKGEVDGEEVKILTSNKILNYYLKTTESDFEFIDEEEHYFGKVPMIEYWNKVNLKGDFESVLSLIDAYNLLQSERINDKERFVQALLVLYGTLAGDDSAEKLEFAKELKKLGMLEMPEGSKAEYLFKTLQESDTEVLKTAIKNDIHKISKVPDLTDENFAANASGVAMKYKLLGLEQLTATKEAYYRMGIRERLTLYKNIYEIKGQQIDVGNIEVQFKRSLPVNETEIATMITNLGDNLSLETKLSQLPFVTDVEAEIKRIQESKAENIKLQQEAFGSYDFQQSNNQEEIDEEER